MSAPSSSAGPGWAALADGVWCVAGGPEPRNALVVTGARGVLLVDPPAGAAAAALTEELRRHTRAEVVSVVLTHAHAGPPPALDPWPGADLRAHEDAPLPDGTPVRTLSSVAVVDLGDRAAELIHPGRAHTAGDLAVHLPGSDVVAVGGLASGDGIPAYGPESFPLEWPAALDLVIGLTGPGDVVIPRTGPPLDRDGLEQQRAGIGVVAETLADLASRGVAAQDAPGAATWPFPVERLGEAVRRGYDQLPRTARRLPML